MSELQTLIAEGLLNGLWQGLALAAVAWACLRLLRPEGAGTRYAVWWLVLLALVALPLVQVGARVFPQSPEPVTVSAVPPLWAEPLAAAESAPAAAPLFPIEVPSGPLVWLLGIWVALTAGMLARLAISYLYLVRLKRGAERPAAPVDLWEAWWREDLDTGRTPELLASLDVRMPLTAGLVRPALLFPSKLFRSLNEGEARKIWLHETAHVRRWDDWTKLGQKLAEALLWFHPAVGAIGRRLSLERELACDEWVVARTGNPKTYAACLSKLAEMVVNGSHASPALGMAADRKQIVRRVEMLLEQSRSPRKRTSKVSAAVLAAVMGAAFLALACAKPALVLAQTEVPPVPAAAPAPPAPSREAVPQPPAPAAPAAPPTVAPVAVPAPVVVPEVRVRMAELEQQMLPLREQMREFEREMRPIQEAMMRINEQMRPLQEQLRSINAEMRPIQERMRMFAEQMRNEAGSEEQRLEIEQHLKAQQQELEQAREELERIPESEMEQMREELERAREEMERAREAEQIASPEPVR